MCWLSWSLGVSYYLNPQGLSGPVQGLLYILCADWDLLLLLKCSLKFWLDSCVSDLDSVASTSDIGNKLPGFARKNSIFFSKLCTVKCVIAAWSVILLHRLDTHRLMWELNRILALKLWYLPFYILISVNKFTSIFPNIYETIYFQPQNNYLWHKISPKMA